MYAVLGAEVYASDEHLSDPMRAIAIRRADTLVAELESEGNTLTPRMLESCAAGWSRISRRSSAPRLM